MKESWERATVPVGGSDPCYVDTSPCAAESQNRTPMAKSVGKGVRLAPTCSQRWRREEGESPYSSANRVCRSRLERVVLRSR